MTHEPAVQELPASPKLALYAERFYEEITEDQKAEFINGAVVMASPVACATLPSATACTNCSTFTRRSTIWERSWARRQWSHLPVTTTSRTCASLQAKRPPTSRRISGRSPRRTSSAKCCRRVPRRPTVASSSRTTPLTACANTGSSIRTLKRWNIYTRGRGLCAAHQGCRRLHRKRRHSRI